MEALGNDRLRIKETGVAGLAGWLGLSTRHSDVTSLRKTGGRALTGGIFVFGELPFPDILFETAFSEKDQSKAAFEVCVLFGPQNLSFPLVRGLGPGDLGGFPCTHKKPPSGELTLHRSYFAPHGKPTQPRLQWSNSPTSWPNQS